MRGTRAANLIGVTGDFGPRAKALWLVAPALPQTAPLNDNVPELPEFAFTFAVPQITGSCCCSWCLPPCATLCCFTPWNTMPSIREHAPLPLLIPASSLLLEMLPSSLEELGKLLEKKLTFEQAVRTLTAQVAVSTNPQQYMPLINRTHTLLRTRHTNPNYWREAQKLYTACQAAGVMGVDLKKFQDEVRAHLGDSDPDPAEQQQQQQQQAAATSAAALLEAFLGPVVSELQHSDHMDMRLGGECLEFIGDSCLSCSSINHLVSSPTHRIRRPSPCWMGHMHASHTLMMQAQLWMMHSAGRVLSGQGLHLRPKRHPQVHRLERAARSRTHARRV